MVKQPPIKHIAFDVGKSRIGVAVSEDGKFVFPHSTIQVYALEQAAQDAAYLIEDLVGGLDKKGISEIENHRFQFEIPLCGGRHRASPKPPPLPTFNLGGKTDPPNPLHVQELHMQSLASDTSYVSGHTPVDSSACENDMSDVVKIYVGLPISDTGEEATVAPYIREFAELLAKLIYPIVPQFVDERYTTRMAHNQLHEVGKAPSKNRHIIDQLAAVNILESALRA